jgi:hypothetical protein
MLPKPWKLRLSVSWLLLAGGGGTACDSKWVNHDSHPMSIVTEPASRLELVTAAPGDARIGAVARRVAIRKRPSASAVTLGYFAAGATLKRSAEPDSDVDCHAGWYGVAPSGFVCLDEKTTIDLSHPTLKARGLLADPNGALPYPYAVARRQLEWFEPDPQHQDGVRERGKLGKGSTFAVVGSWNTLDDYDQQRRLAMLTLGAFVPAKDLEPLRPAPELGFDLDPERDHLPLGLVLEPKLTKYRVADDRALATGTLDAKGRVSLTAKARSVDQQRYWPLLEGDAYVAERDVLVVRQRLEFPDFVASDTHWVDVDVAQGLLVLYEGRKAKRVTRTIAKPAESIPRGSAWVRTKQITDVLSGAALDARTPLACDLPWIIELDNGVTLRASLNAKADAPAELEKAKPVLELRPADAAYLFRFLAPALPDNWHVIVANESRHVASPVLLR